eukprot:CAMPEP_0113936616 /NCGR_PEP_ID=MMETSP1339-20121228/3486_1 /TAXON_ID=94617 /ORGANISM="Fibrocapsa japonica" /LENGTH=53 /DNA_ID=CAMNT_0000939147 /DNA_START=467 /DNA_END=625 /DNA_ORIENTATION=+ /assembly_acc=CAM_ASM_000762
MNSSTTTFTTRYGLVMLIFAPGYAKALWMNQGTGSPTRMSNTFDPMEEEMAIS